MKLEETIEDIKKLMEKNKSIIGISIKTENGNVIVETIRKEV